MPDLTNAMNGRQSPQQHLVERVEAVIATIQFKHANLVNTVSKEGPDVYRMVSSA